MTGGTRRRCARVALSLVAVGSIAACTPGEEARDVLPAPSGATTGGTLTVGIAQPGSVDPGNAYEPAGTLIARTMCDTLLVVDPRTGELAGGLAASWLVTDEGKTITVRLRRDVRFHDGQPVTAEDVVFTLSRSAGAEFASLAAHLLEPIYGFAEIRGEVETDDDRAREELIGVRALTGDTVEISLTTPLAGFVRVLTHPVTAPVSKAAAEADPDGFANRPVCAGPYQLSEPWAPAARTIRLDRVADHHGGIEGYTSGGSGYADVIEFHVLEQAVTAPEDDVPSPAPSTAPTPLEPLPGPGGIPEPQVADPRFGTFDLTPVQSGQRDEAGRIDDAALVTGPAPGIEYVGLPAGDGAAFADRDVRVALSLALDREALADDLYDGDRIPASGFLPATLPPEWYRDAPCGEVLKPGPDLAAARRILDRAGADLRDQPITFYVNDDFDNLAFARAVAEQWEDAFRLRIEVEALAWEDYLARGERLEGFDGIFRESWSWPYATADAYLHPLFHTSGGGAANLSRYSDPDFDRSIERLARRAVDDGDQLLEYQRLEDLLCDDLPLIPVLFDQSTYLVSDEVTSASGSYLDPSTGEPLLRELGRWG